MASLSRSLQVRVPPMVGADVEAAARAMIRYLHDDWSWSRFVSSPKLVRRTFGPGKRELAKTVQRKAGLPATGVVGPATDRVLVKAGAYDQVCEQLLAEYAASQVTICYPHPLGFDSQIGQWFHITAGLAGNWAVDFMAPGGTPVVAVENAEVVKVSGHPPTYVVNGATGIFGWNLHYVTDSGYRYFSTHYGEIFVRAGQRVACGQLVGRVGHWPHDEGRSHTHLGVTSPKGWADGQHRIETVAHAPRLPYVEPV